MYKKFYWKWNKIVGVKIKKKIQNGVRGKICCFKMKKSLINWFQTIFYIVLYDLFAWVLFEKLSLDISMSFMKLTKNLFITVNFMKHFLTVRDLRNPIICNRNDCK